MDPVSFALDLAGVSHVVRRDDSISILGTDPLEVGRHAAIRALPGVFSIRAMLALGTAAMARQDAQGAIQGAFFVLSGLIAPLAHHATLPLPTGIRRRMPITEANAAIMLARARRYRETGSVDVAIPRTATEAGLVSGPFSGIAVESAAGAAQAGLVRGGVRPADVNPIAGYNVPVIARRAEATRYVNSTEGRADVADIRATLAGEASRAIASVEASAEDAGVLFSFHGNWFAPRYCAPRVGAFLDAMTTRWTEGAVAWGVLVEIATAASVDAPAQPSHRSALGQAIRTLGAGWDVAASSRGRARHVDWTVTRVSDPRTAQVGEPFGRIAVKVELLETGEIKLTHEDTDHARHVAGRIREAYEAYRATLRVDGMAAHEWCVRTLRGLGAIAMGPAFRVHVKTSSALVTSLADGAVAEIRSLLDEARAGGVRARTRILGDLEAIRARVAALATVCDVAPLRAAIAALETEAPADATEIRGALIWEDLASDVR